MKTQKTMRGVTLVEIAIVLVIIGLLLGGVLKGQELINNARVRAIADQQLGMQVAWNAFQERFQAMPGDFPRATRYIKRTINGSGDGRIDAPDANTSRDMVLVFNHLTESGLLRCSECQLDNATIGNDPADIKVFANGANGVFGLRNAYGGIMGIFHDKDNFQLDSSAGARGNNNYILMTHTGPLVPSNILAEVDLKIDDSYSNIGSFRYSRWYPTAADNAAQAQAGPIGQCTNSDVGGAVGVIDVAGRAVWREATRQPASFGNCGAAFTIQ